MLRTELDAIPAAELLDLPVDTVVDEGFARDFWKPLWVQAAETWFEDGGAMYQYMVNGFKGWAERTDFEIYCDLRFTYFTDLHKPGLEMGKRWATLTGMCADIGKYS